MNENDKLKRIANFISEMEPSKDTCCHLIMMLAGVAIADGERHGKIAEIIMRTFGEVGNADWEAR